MYAEQCRAQKLPLPLPLPPAPTRPQNSKERAQRVVALLAVRLEVRRLRVHEGRERGQAVQVWHGAQHVEEAVEVRACLVPSLVTLTNVMISRPIVINHSPKNL